MPLPLFPNRDHDHDDCTSNVMNFAESFCQKAGLRLTKLRRDILREIAASHKAIGAYQIIDNLAAQGTNLAPISVYRSLDFLQEAGLIHRLESINSYFACQRNFEDNDRCCVAQPLVFLLCDECGTIGEVESPPLLGLIDAMVQKNDFAMERAQLEIKGLCRLCAGQDIQNSKKAGAGADNQLDQRLGKLSGSNE